jgi:hypothetical protein
MRHVQIILRRDTNTVPMLTVPEWEVPILEFRYDPENIERTGEVVLIDREYPSAEFEFDRLVRAYGSDAKSGVPHAAAVFGQGSIGIKTLKRIMLDERDIEREERLVQAEHEEEMKSNPRKVDLRGTLDDDRPAARAARSGKKRAVVAASSGDPLFA